jgi:hypothetical protein
MHKALSTKEGVIDVFYLLRQMCPHDTPLVVIGEAPLTECNVFWTGATCHKLTFFHTEHANRLILC